VLVTWGQYAIDMLLDGLVFFVLDKGLERPWLRGFIFHSKLDSGIPTFDYIKIDEVS